ncbi:MAG: response regulator [Alphaproteobacteria bacterium]|nr:response regulator [Alphaproteobacteria bacterium]
MSQYDFDRLTCLVVEDSTFMRSLIVSCLTAIGIHRVKIAEDGGDAIDLLRLTKTDPMKAGIQGVDLVISNWQMSPVDGLMLLRWIRRGADTPDRFLPVVFISAFSEPERVREARDLGATEFLTKPFSVHALAQKLTAIIDRPRQFVHTRDYFGPDRRRQTRAIGFPERRLLTEKSEGVEVVYDG